MVSSGVVSFYYISVVVASITFVIWLHALGLRKTCENSPSPFCYTDWRCGDQSLPALTFYDNIVPVCLDPANAASCNNRWERLLNPK